MISTAVQIRSPPPFFTSTSTNFGVQYLIEVSKFFKGQGRNNHCVVVHNGVCYTQINPDTQLNQTQYDNSTADPNFSAGDSCDCECDLPTTTTSSEFATPPPVTSDPFDPPGGTTTSTTAAGGTTTSTTAAGGTTTTTVAPCECDGDTTEEASLECINSADEFVETSGSRAYWDSFYKYQDPTTGQWAIYKPSQSCASSFVDSFGRTYCSNLDAPVNSSGIPSSDWTFCRNFTPPTTIPTTTTPVPCSPDGLASIPSWQSGVEYFEGDVVQHCFVGSGGTLNIHVCTAEWTFDPLKTRTTEEPSASASDWSVVDCCSEGLADCDCTTEATTTTSGPTTTPAPSCDDCIDGFGNRNPSCTYCGSIGAGGTYWQQDAWYVPGDCLVYLPNNTMYVCLVDHLSQFSAGSAPPGIPTPYPADTDIGPPPSNSTFWSSCGLWTTTTSAP